MSDLTREPVLNPHLTSLKWTFSVSLCGGLVVHFLTEIIKSVMLHQSSPRMSYLATLKCIPAESLLE